MIRRIYHACIWLLLGTGFVIGLLSVFAELERRDAAETNRMLADRAATERARIYGELDERGRYMTSYEAIAKK